MPRIGGGGETMSTLTFADKTYAVDSDDYLSDFNAWDENFARAVAQCG
jgi:sulfur relay (sulfurtransferase) DsrC/TusE family protein